MRKPTGARLPPLPAPSAAQRQHAQNFLSRSGSPKFLNFFAVVEKGYKLPFLNIFDGNRQKNFKILGVALTKNSERTAKNQRPSHLSTNKARPRGRRLRKTKFSFFPAPSPIPVGSSLCVLAFGGGGAPVLTGGEPTSHASTKDGTNDKIKRSFSFLYPVYVYSLLLGLRLLLVLVFLLSYLYHFRSISFFFSLCPHKYHIRTYLF